MHRFLFVLTMLWAFAAPAQQTIMPTAQPAAGSNWQRVLALPAGTSIYVKSGGHTTRCSLTSADADDLACTSRGALTFQRTAIRSVALPRRTRSTAILAGVGAGVGALTVKAAAVALFGGFFGGKAKGSVYAGGAGLGAVVFGGIGYGTDATRSTVYKAP